MTRETYPLHVGDIVENNEMSAKRGGRTTYHSLVCRECPLVIIGVNFGLITSRHQEAMRVKYSARRNSGVF